MGLLVRSSVRLGPTISDDPEFKHIIGVDHNWGINLDGLLPSGYVSMSNHPDVKMAVHSIADLISTMTIKLMMNTPQGDVRILNGLSRKLDINPYSLITRKSWLYNIVSTMLIEGDGNAFVYPKIKDGLIMDLIPLQPNQITIEEHKDTYRIKYGDQTFKNDQVLHFSINPDPNQVYRGRGNRVILRDILNNLSQAATTKSDYLSSKYRPNMIVSIDGTTGDFKTEAERERLKRSFLRSERSGEPMVIPKGVVSIDQVRPLTINDLAINESVEIDKRSVATMFGVPPYLLGVGEYDEAEYNHFITSTIRSIAQGIEQELTKKLVLKDDWFIKLNPNSLLSYDIDKRAKANAELYTKGIITGNEVRDSIGMGPLEELGDLTILENYIPVSEIGNQNKLKGGD